MSLLVDCAALAFGPRADVVGAPHGAHAERRGGVGEVVSGCELDDALAGDAEHLTYLVWPDEGLLRHGEDSSHADTVQPTIVTRKVYA